jgi:hypothetical protein
LRNGKPQKILLYKGDLRGNFLSGRTGGKFFDVFKIFFIPTTQSAREAR